MCSNSLNTSDFLNPLRLNNLDRCSEHEEFKTQRFNCQCPSSHSVNFHADSLVSAVKQNCPSCTEPGWGVEWQKSLSPLVSQTKLCHPAGPQRARDPWVLPCGHKQGSLWKQAVVFTLTFLYTHKEKGYSSVGEWHSRPLPWHQVDLVRSEIWNRTAGGKWSWEA